MSKSLSVFVCQRCEYQSPKWIGQCPNCGEWNMFVETLIDQSAKKSIGGTARAVQSVRLSEVQHADHLFRRISTGMQEFDRVLGGGVVLGSVTLLAGEPGIGKSTLLTQLMIKILIDKTNKNGIMYVCGEESPEQIALRIDRIAEHMGARKSVSAWKEQVIFVLSNDVDEVLSAIQKEHPGMVIVDSIQSMQTSDLTGVAGSIGQLKECTQRLTTTAKSQHIPTFLVGHVTKDGNIAGPKSLEHIVDTVLELSGERSEFFRVLRAVKNRFGATDEVGVFSVVESGLEEVTNPSKLFLQETQIGIPGSAIVSIMEGTRPMLIEMQALVVSSQLAIPRRVGRGVSLSRIQLLAAVLQKHCGLPLGTTDIFVNVAGGFTVNEPGVDLGIAMAIASSCKNIPLPADAVYVGEIGLLGEVRTVSMLEKRINEAKRLGYTKTHSAKTVKRVAELVRMLVR